MTVPVYLDAGTGAATTNTTSISVPYPATVAANDLLVLHVHNWSHLTGNSITTPSGWTEIGSGYTTTVGLESRAYTKTADGTETGSLTVSHNNGLGEGAFGRIYRFNHALSTGTLVEGAATANGTTTTVSDRSVVTTNSERLAVNLVAINDDVSVTAFTGETGGTWVQQSSYTSTVGRDVTLQIQTADIATATTINGGSFTAGTAVAPGNNKWSILGFAILPPNVLVGLASETDTALPMGALLEVPGLRATLGVAAETDTALAMTAVATPPEDTELFTGVRFVTTSGGGFEDLSDRVTSASIRRGRPFNLDRIEAGTASVRFNNGDGALDPANNNGPYYGNILPLRPLWLYRVQDGVTYQRFQGVIERYEPEWAQPFHQFMGVEASDAFDVLANRAIVSDTAALETVLTGANNDLVFTAVEAGEDGDNITVTYTVAGTDTELDTQTNQPYDGNATTKAKFHHHQHFGVLGSLVGQTRQNTVHIVPVEVQGTDINVTVATNSGGTATSTASDVKASLEANPDVVKLVTVAHATGSSGAGVVTAMEKTSLSGGKWTEELAGARINRVLDAVGWDTDARDIDDGAFVMAERGFSLKDNVSALSHIQDVAESDLGYVFVNAAGVIVFHDGVHRSVDSRSTTSQATFSDDGTGFPYYDLQISFDKERIANDITVTAGAEGALPQTAEDTDSQDVYERRSLNRSTLVSSDSDALLQAETLLEAYKDPRYRFEQITLLDTEGMTEEGSSGVYGDGDYGDDVYGVSSVVPNTWTPVVLGLEIGDLVTVRTTPPVTDATTPYTISYDCFVEEITDSIAPGLPWQTTLKLSLFSESLSQPPAPGGGGGGGAGVILNSIGGTLIIDDPVNGLVAA